MTALLKHACNNRTFDYPKFISVCICVSLSSSSRAISFCLKSLLPFFFFPCFFLGKKKKINVWSTHTWLSSLWTALGLFSLWEQLHFIFPERTTKSVMKLPREWKVFLAASLWFQQVDFWVFSTLSLYIYTHTLKYVRTVTALMMIILCKIESIFSFLKLLCQITFTAFQPDVVWLTSLISHNWFSWLQKSQFCA